jgi:hypothetical protein
MPVMNAPSMFHKRSRGQALIVIIAAFMGMLLFMGLMLDLGQLFLAKAYLRRTADAASLAAAGQFREGRTAADLIAAAEEVSHLNNIDPTRITVETCQTNPSDADLCVLSGGIPRKLVRVSIEMRYPLTFLALINIKFVDLTESSISEAASLDLVLVLDVSESMTWDYPTGDPLRDPSICNTGHDVGDSCMPFYYVKQNAKDFVDQILGPDPTIEQDRVAIVTFANGWQAGTLGTYLAPLGPGGHGWTRDKGEALTYIENLTVYDPNEVCTVPAAAPTDPEKVSPCRYYMDSIVIPENFLGISCPQKILLGDEAVSACGTTNFGGGLFLAGNQFAVDKRLEALWVVVVLTDGAVNSTFTTDSKLGGATDDFVFPEIAQDDIAAHLPFGFCPDGTWWTPGESGDWSIVNSAHRMWCQDEDAESFHSPVTAIDYDAADFAHDQANFVACAARSPASGCNGIRGQGAVIFTIGLGNAILALDADQTAPYGGYLLRYVAAVGDDGDPDSDPCEGETDFSINCGNYYFSASGSGLAEVFDAIASRIFTRLTK